MALETADEFFTRIDDGVMSGRIGMVELKREFANRDAAVALAALDEVRAQASLDAFNIPESNAIIRAVEAVRAKCAAKVGG